MPTTVKFLQFDCGMLTSNAQLRLVDNGSHCHCQQQATFV